MTGGDGFLGRHVQHAARKFGHEFFGYDTTSGHDVLNRNGFLCKCSEKKPDVVIHAAAVADLYKASENLDANFNINVTGTYYVGRVCSTLGIPLIYISTCCAYGNQSAQKMADEETEPIPTEAYAWSKLAGEKALGCVGAITGCILRLGTFYGPGMRGALFNARAIDAALGGETITVHGTGEQTRRYIHVSDTANAIIGFAESVKLVDHGPYKNNPLPIFNIIGEEEVSVNETVRAVSGLVGKNSDVSYVPQRDGQIIKQQIDGRRARSFLGWNPEISYAEGMRQCFEAARGK